MLCTAVSSCACLQNTKKYNQSLIVPKKFRKKAGLTVQQDKCAQKPQPVETQIGDEHRLSYSSTVQ